MKSWFRTEYVLAVLLGVLIIGLSLALLTGANLHAQAGDRILLRGPSGSGKSTLFRSLAGIWPFASGTVARPPAVGTVSR